MAGLLDPRPPLWWEREQQQELLGQNPQPQRYGLLDTLSYYAGPELTQVGNAAARIAGLLAEPVLSVLPGSGEAMSAWDSLRQSRDALASLQQGNYMQAGISGANALASALGAVPIYGMMTRGAKPVVNTLLGATQESDDFAKRAQDAARWYVEYHSGVRGKAARDSLATKIARHLTPEDLEAPGLQGYKNALARASQPRMPSRFDLADKDSMASALKQALGGRIMEGREGRGASRYFDFDGGRMRVSDHTPIARRSFEHTHEVLVRRIGDEVVLDVNGTELRFAAGDPALKSKDTLRQIVDLLKRPAE